MRAAYLRRERLPAQNRSAFDAAPRSRLLTPREAGVQAKLALGHSGDAAEVEADQAAAQMMGGARKSGAARPKPQSVQPAQVGRAPDEVDEVVQSPGEPLDSAVRSYFEPRFGHDFSRIRIHTDSKAAESAGMIGARAYATGPHIVFGKGQFSPGSDAGRRLIAHELTHTVQQQAGPAVVARQDDPDAGTPDIRDAGEPLPGGVPEQPTPQPVEEPQPAPPQPAPPVQQPQQQCTTTYRPATSFQSFIDLVRAAEARLTAAGISSVTDQIHVLRGIYYGTTWSADYAVERSTLRNEGFQRFTRPSTNPAASVPQDPRTVLSCGLFTALQQSQDLVDASGRHVDVGHLIIGLDARADPAFRTNVTYPVMGGLTTIDLGGTGTELVTWLGDLGGGASTLAVRRTAAPSTSASAVFVGSDYGGSINLEGDVAAFVVASGGGTSIVAPTFAPGTRLSDALQSYLSPAGAGAAWTARADTFLRMYGATIDASGTLTNRASLVSTLAAKIQTFACNYMASRVRDGHTTYATATAAAANVPPAADEVAGAFIDALDDSRRTGARIQATRFASPGTPRPGACAAQIAAGRAAGAIGL